MNKTLLLSAAMLRIAVLLGSMVYGNTAYANRSEERRACADKYLPDDEAGFRICTGEIGTPDPSHSGTSN
jgi:hypothetical protein